MGDGGGLMATKTNRTGHRPYSGRPRQRRPAASDFDEPFRAPTTAERRRIDAEQAGPYKEAYEAGRKEGRQQAGRSPSPKKRPSSSRRRPPGARSARAAARQLEAPVRAQVTSGLKSLGLMLGIVALYNVLTPPGPQGLSGVLGGISKGLGWLSSATPIPKRS